MGIPPVLIHVRLGCSIIHHPAIDWGTPFSGNPHIYIYIYRLIDIFANSGCLFGESSHRHPGGSSSHESHGTRVPIPGSIDRI